MLLLNEMKPDERQRPDIDEIHAAARRALELVAELPLPEGSDEG